MTVGVFLRAPNLGNQCHLELAHTVCIVDDIAANNPFRAAATTIDARESILNLLRHVRTPLQSTGRHWQSGGLCIRLA